MKQFVAHSPPSDISLQGEMLRTNIAQQSFYEDEDLSLTAKGNFVTKIWRHLRRRQQFVRAAIGIDARIYDDHWDWMGDLSWKDVLDLGCFSGNVLSLEIASRAKSYLGIDLSRTAIESLQRKLADKQLSNARAEAVDFLSDEFGNSKFDVIYAHSVAHHFKYFDVFLRKLESHLAPGGIVITTDPMETSRPVRIARVIYRPFQSDAEWEWPFTQTTFSAIKQHFDIVHIQGTMGRAKWSIPVSFVSRALGARLGSRWHEHDRRAAREEGSALWSCMQVSMCWKCAAPHSK